MKIETIDLNRGNIHLVKVEDQSDAGPHARKKMESRDG